MSCDHEKDSGKLGNVMSVPRFLARTGFAVMKQEMVNRARLARKQGLGALCFRGLRGP